MTIEEIERTLQTVAENQANHASRIERLEDAFQRVALAIEQLTRIAVNTDERLDVAGEGQVYTDARLDALIDQQIQLTHRVDSVAVTVGSLAIVQAKTDDQIAALLAMQARTEERIRELIDGAGQKT